ncbi:hypothetical protein CVT24_001886 [Panaeolus cyanescens]|uniref:amidase n=1 Tax=Panaeolus cyanescens TaxID=181874 RepID=A0A409YES8_9AGAR|nr:hypothetical protein CVT24_001886 [Panaeolus cyanescens]
MKDWQTLCADKRQRQFESIPKEWIILPSGEFPGMTVKKRSVQDVPATCGLLNEKELEITETTDVDTILDRLRHGTWSSEDVTRAFYKRAVIAHQLTNCLTEIFPERALARARELDDILKKTGKVVGPLHGLPISLKDQFTMQGLETVMGYASGINNYAKEDCVLVQVLYSLGAVPFVRTNVPQTLMVQSFYHSPSVDLSQANEYGRQWGETHNNVFGRTSNPYNRALTAGGSSGGEGALVGMKGSPLGVGTDIGGSLRIPSGFCGLYTIRPSYGRLPYYGAANAISGQESISSVLGPMTNSLSGLKTFVKSIVDAKPWNLDPLVIRKPWSEEEWNLCDHGGPNAKLCFAIMWDNEIVKPHPPLIRALKMAKSALEDAGHTVIDWIPHRHVEIYKNAETIFVADGNHDYASECAKTGEPLITTMAPSEEELEAKTYEFSPPYPYAKHLVGDPPKHLSAYELWSLHEEKRALRKSHLDHWNKTVESTGTGRPVDAILCPSLAYTAVPHGMNTDSFYTTMCNALDYTTSVFPVTTVDPEVDIPQPPHKFHNHEDEAIFNLYATDVFKGCPVGLQLIGRTLEEEAVIRMTYIVDEALTVWKQKATS